MEIRGSEILGTQKGLLCHKKTKVGFSKSKGEARERKDEPYSKDDPDRNSFNVGNLAMSTGEKI